MGIEKSEKHIVLWSDKNGPIPAVGCQNRKVRFWWKCTKCDYEWEGTPQSISLKKTNVCKSCSTAPLNDLTGKKFGKWEVIERTKDKAGRGAWLCCCECGAERVIRGHHIKRTTKCKKCYIKETRKHDKVSYQYWKHIMHGAKVRSLDFEITIDEAYELFLKQDKKCALTGDELVIFESSTEWERLSSKTENHASLDRIDSNRGYTIDNIQWVRKDINLMKMAFSQEHFIDLCNKVSNFAGRLIE